MEQPQEEGKDEIKPKDQNMTGTQNEDLVKTPENVDSANDTVQNHAMSSYIDQWDKYFESSGELLSRLKKEAFTDSLRSCHFRSICWKLFLGCLPEDISKWESTLSKHRTEYSSIKEKHVTNPHITSEGKDLQMENPLSQSDSSCWSQYFKNNELKTMIERDVRRTCPEMDFFHDDKVRSMLGDILFCYAREHERLSYRQGMHELLAPLIFVLHCDLQGAAHAKEFGNLPDLIRTVLDQDYLEHDAFTMFSKVMDATNAWYAVSDARSDSTSDSDASQKSPIPAQPFRSNENQMQGSPLAITNKLNHIHDNILAKFDVELHEHLNRLEIIPQVYGLRWVRLLFGREFDLQDLLVLWDALFADSEQLDLVDYIFVAMMYNIRYELLNGEYCTCMQILMKYPPIEDIYDLVHLALHFRDPKNNVRPVQRSKPAPSASKPAPSNQTSKKNKILPNFKLDNPFTSISRSFKKGFRTSPPRARKNDLTETNSSIQNAPPRLSQSDIFESKSSGPKIERMRSMSGLDNYIINKRLSDPSVNEITRLKEQITELQEKCQFCSDKLDASICLLQSHVLGKSSRVNSVNEEVSGDAESSSDVTANEIVRENEEPLVALANLKKVRDILRGVVGFSEPSRHPSVSTPSLDQRVERLPNPPDHLPEKSEASSEQLPATSDP